MQNIPLQALPNQSMQVPIDDNQWDISLKLTNGTISVTISLNEILLVENVRIVANTLILPYRYEENNNGNFVLSTQSFNIPDYTQFSITQMLFYITPEELTTARNSVPVIITADDFDPAAGTLPLRFAPQGYRLA